MTNLSSKSKSINRTSYNASTVLILPFSLQWRTIRRMGPSPSWTLLLNQRLRETVYHCVRKPTHTDQYLQWNSHHHLSANFSVIHTLFHRAQTVCNNPELLHSNPELFHKEKTHLRNALTQCKYPNGLLTRWREGSTNLPVRLLRGLTTRTLQVPSLLPKKLKPKVTLLYPTHKVSVKVSRRSVVGMAYRPTSKVVIPSETY